MENIAAKIVVTVPGPAKTTVLSMKAELPFMPVEGATLTVECHDNEPLPLIVEHASYNITRRDLFASTSLPPRRARARGGSKPATRGVGDDRDADRRRLHCHRALARRRTSAVTR